MSRQTEIAALLRKAATATSLNEQVELVRQAELLKNEALEERTANWSAEDAKINDTLVPGFVHERHTAATDWLTELDTSFDPREANNRMVAEASLWFGRVSDDVKSYGDEYAEQARNLARRLAGQFGEGADVAERAFLDEADRLRTQAVRAGLVKQADDGDGDADDTGAMDSSQSGNYALGAPVDSNGPGVSTTGSLDKSTARERMIVREATFVDELYESLHVANALEGAQPDSLSSGLPAGTTDSNRGPVMQELANPNPSQDVVPVNDPGLENPQPFPVRTTSGTRKESRMHVTCPNCHGQGKVAVRREAASGLPQIDQIVDPHDNPSQTPYPAEVAFQWTLNPAQQVQEHVQEAEGQINERNQRSPLASQSVRHQAGGRDNSGWIGDMGAKGTDYPGEQIGQYPQGQAGGYVDPVYGQGGDQAPAQLRPYGQGETADFTNNPGMNWQPGQPTQYDNAWRSVTNDGQGSQQAGPGGSVQASWRGAVDADPNLRAALEYVEAARRRVGR